MTHTRFTNLTDEELLRKATHGAVTPQTDEQHMIAELALRFEHALDELEDQDELLEHAEAAGQIETFMVTVQ